MTALRSVGSDSLPRNGSCASNTLAEPIENACDSISGAPIPAQTSTIDVPSYAVRADALRGCCPWVGKQRTSRLSAVVLFGIRAAYFVRVQWLDTVPEAEAVNEVGLFGNQNTVCQPTTPKWRHTVERLKTHFSKWQD